MPQAIRQVVKRETIKAVTVPKDFGDMVEIIVLPLEKKHTIPTESGQLMNMQERTGFARTVLADKAEDVWNEV